MNTTKLHNLEISEKFLKEINNLTKMSIKVYLSLVYLKYKRGNNFHASHHKISINHFDDEDPSCYPEWFGIRTDQGQYFKAFKQLEALELIKVYRGRTKNDGYKVNRYRVY